MQTKHINKITDEQKDKALVCLNFLWWQVYFTHILIGPNKVMRVRKFCVMQIFWTPKSALNGNPLYYKDDLMYLQQYKAPIRDHL